MKLRRLCKSASSDGERDCPAMYVTEDPAMMVAQGRISTWRRGASCATWPRASPGLPSPTETVLRAAALFLAENGRPAMLVEVEAFLVARAGADS